MRILFLSNFYPPHEIGGQEYSCQQVVEGLRQRGHTTMVLTSMHGVNNIPTEDDGVVRRLYLEMDLTPWRHSVNFFTKRKAREEHNLRSLRQTLNRFKPDVIFIWGMWNLPRSLAALAEAHQSSKVIYRFAEYWPTLPSQHEFYWRAPAQGRVSRLPKAILSRIALWTLARDEELPRLKFENVICVSAATRDTLVEQGIPVSHAKIIHTGLDMEPYLNGADNNTQRGERPLKLLYAGRLAAEKGVETAIQALAYLASNGNQPEVTLAVAGAGAADYKDQLHGLTARNGLEDRVTFLGLVPHEEMPALLKQFDVLLVPSVWQEPLARTVLEGMAAGLVVVATPTGGTAEIIEDGNNGLLFVPGDGEDLARKITCLAADPALRQQLAHAGQQTVSQRFSRARMLDEIESYLLATGSG